jgi:hypothetical protein
MRRAPPATVIGPFRWKVEAFWLNSPPSWNAVICPPVGNNNGQFTVTVLDPIGNEVRPTLHVCFATMIWT